jgi:hypothetical protein
MEGILTMRLTRPSNGELDDPLERSRYIQESKETQNPYPELTVANFQRVSTQQGCSASIDRCSWLGVSWSC